MKYILNETPIRTTNGFRVNDVKVDLDIPNEENFHDYNINVPEININSAINHNFKSSIGLEHKSYKNSIININDNFDKIIKLEYIFNENENLIDNIDLNIEKNIDVKILLEYKSISNTRNFHNGNININLKENSSINLTIMNSLNSNCINLLSGNINCDVNSKSNITLIDLSGKIRLYNFKSNGSNNSLSKLNNIYIGKNNDLLDLNYNYINNSENSISNIEVQGVLDNNAIKTFKGIIDFKENSKKSIGRENENCLLLSDSCISKSLPVLLCHEEDVDGTHSVSSGRIDQNKLFYLMSRGLDECESKKLIIKANFNHIIDEIPEDLKELVNKKIDELI